MFAACASLLGCRSAQFDSGGIGYYPPGSDEMTSKFGAVVYEETAASGSMYDRQDKDVWVRVETNTSNGPRLLDDHLGHIYACWVTGTVRWTTFNHLHVDLEEEGWPDSSDPYSVALAKFGPRHLMSLDYVYDQASKHFVRSK
jgi:hypothetical protein